MAFKQGTTPLLIYTIDDLDVSTVEEVIFTITSEAGKALDPITVEEPETNTFMIGLTQEQTMQLQGSSQLEAQINFKDKHQEKTVIDYFYVNDTLGTKVVEGNKPAAEGGVERILERIKGDVAWIVTPEASEELLEAVTGLFNATKEVADSVRQDADAGVFDGEDGYSPEVTVKTQTPSTYILHIKTKDDEYDTPNLQGQGGEGSIEVGDGLQRVGNVVSADLDENSILEFNNHKLSADTSGLQPTITGGNGIDVSSDVVSVDLASQNSFLNFQDGKLYIDRILLGANSTFRSVLTNTNFQNPLASKTYVDNLISGRLKRLVVESLPTQNIDTNTIYMILKSVPTTNNIYDEYMYINNAWELIGSTEVDLSNYYTKSEVYNKQESNTYYQPMLIKGNGIDITNATISAKIASSGNILKFVGGELVVLGSDVANDISFQSSMPYVTAIRQGLTTGNNSPLQPKLTAGTNITIDSNNVISASGGGLSYTFTDGLKESSGTVGLDIASGSKLLIDANDKLDVDLSSKQDKTTISTDTTSTTVSLTLADNHEYRYTQELSALTLTMPSGDFISSIVFASGSTPTQMTYDSSIKWSGDDVTNGQFVPTEKTYNIVMWYDGINVNGVVRGV